MTPKQRDVMTSLKRQIRLLENHYRHMKRQLRVLSEQFEEYPIIKAGDFTPADVDGLVRLNQRLHSLEHYLREVGQQESARLDVRFGSPWMDAAAFSTVESGHRSRPEDAYP